MIVELLCQVQAQIARPLLKVCHHVAWARLKVPDEVGWCLSDLSGCLVDDSRLVLIDDHVLDRCHVSHVLSRHVST